METEMEQGNERTSERLFDDGLPTWDLRNLGRFEEDSFLEMDMPKMDIDF